MMALEEAIIHCMEKACGNTQCALEHQQLAEWLQELQQYRKNARKEQPEVDLWKEIHRYFNPHGMELQFDRSKGNTILKPEQLIDFARHFWNKGYNARKEGKK